MNPVEIQSSVTRQLEEQPKSLSHRQERIFRHIEHAIHLLTSQGPIEVFVHHNTLHALEDLQFHEAVHKGHTLYGCQGYWSENRYREALARDRIRPYDLAEELLADLGDDATQLIGYLGTRYSLQLAMLQYPLVLGSDSELTWLIAASGALDHFRNETPSDARDQTIDATRRWVMRDLRSNGVKPNEAQWPPGYHGLVERFDEKNMEEWSAANWESFTLNLLWNICRDGVSNLPQHIHIRPNSVRLRDHWLEATGQDADVLVHDTLIRFCASFLDQGVAHRSLPLRDEGFLRSWLSLYRNCHPIDHWLRGLPEEIRRIERSRSDPLTIIAESLEHFGIASEDEEAFIAETLLALRGWAGMLWQMESNAEWTIHPAPRGTLVEYLAARLILERVILTNLAREILGDSMQLRHLRQNIRIESPPPNAGALQRAYLVFQLAQLRRWTPEALFKQSKDQWCKLIEEIEGFHGDQRRRIYHGAFERRYRVGVLDGMVHQASKEAASIRNPVFQIACCLDEREESFRRHLEEIEPRCETFGIAGFFGVVMYYRGAADAHYLPLCPIVVKPSHYVEEEVAVTFEEDFRRKSRFRRLLGKTSHRLHKETRSALGGMLSSVLGSLASVPLVARVLFPRLTARTRKLLGRFIEPPPITRLVLERDAANPPGPNQLGFSLGEMVTIASRCLEDMGLTSRFAPLVFLMGHGSESLNNPHASAYNCGACGGGRGGPNARAIATMLNDPRVRSELDNRGLMIPSGTHFVGAFHNTCNEQVSYFDLERLPSTHRRDFEIAKATIDEARRRNAHERCRRFESAPLRQTQAAALKHVEDRAEDLSQVRPEYGHATNAICIVGRRQRTRGLFLDRRAFLTSYDPSNDPDHAILTRILQAVIPVCAGINLEYYFGAVDPTGYGCGTKLPHNITGLIGVMDGAASDLRTGLNWQMVELHEPMRILFIIECSPETLQAILERNPALRRLVENEWIQMATLDPDRPSICCFRQGKFEPYVPESTTLPTAASSAEWYRGWRRDLGLASIENPSAATAM